MNQLVSNQGNPATLLDNLILGMNLKNDADLARRLQVAPPVISKIRHCKLPVGAGFLINAHEESGFSIKELKQFAGIKPFTPFHPRAE